jgi:hypothetical protein
MLKKKIILFHFSFKIAEDELVLSRCGKLLIRRTNIELL